MKPTRALLCLLLCAGAATPLLAQEEHPNRATGAREETAYASYGSDDVNLYNGNLTYRIPIGTPVPVGPQLSISPALVYNSNHERNWRVRKVVEEHLTGDRAVGAGWLLHFGRLVPVSDRIPVGSIEAPPSSPEPATLTTRPVRSMVSVHWGYEAPDGAVHEFFDRRVEATCDIGEPSCQSTPPPDCFSAASRPAGHCYVYTHDGSFLRLDPIDPEHGNAPTVYFPDGTFRVLGYAGGRFPDLEISPPTDLDFAYPEKQFHTTIVGDNFGNQFTVEYYGDPLVPGAPPHPLAAAGVPSNQHDALPYRVFPSSASTPHTPLRAGATFQFEYETFTYQSDLQWPDVVAPRLTGLRTPTAVPNGAGGFQQALWLFGHDAPGQPPDARLTRLTLPTSPGQEALFFAFGWEGDEQRFDLPTGGSIHFLFDDITLWARQPSFRSLDPATQEYKFEKDLVRGVSRRRVLRLVRPADGGTPVTEEGVTTYLRSYRIEDGCSASSREDCRLRVDVWSPRGNTSEPYRVTRTIFGESDGATNTPLYARPLETRDHALYVTGPDRAPVDAGTPLRTVAFTYAFDGPVSATNPSEGTGAGTSHNTRESARLTTWGSRSLRTERLGWDGNGHWGTTVEYENDGTGEVEVRRTVATHLNRVSADSASPARWILDPVLSRTVSRPMNTQLDPADANLATTETFTYDTAGFRTGQQIISTDLGYSRTLTRTWEKGTNSSGPCLATGGSSIECANLGFPKKLTETMSGSLDSTGLSSTYERRYYYRYSTLAAARDSVSFYHVDRDVAPNGQVIGTRGSEGRTSLYDLSPQLTTTTTYDLLGRPISVQPPGEGPEETTWFAQSVLRVKRDATGAEASRRQVFFDQLGRPTAERVTLPGGSASCRITTYDAAGRTVAQSEWWKNGDNGLGNRCDDLLNVQAVLDSGVAQASVPPGTTYSNFDVLDRPRLTRLADGSTVESDFTGWWLQETTRTVNTGPTDSISSTTVVERDGLGQVRAVTEPATTKADGTAMNPAETTTYRYDHEGRVISVRKPRSDANVVYNQWQVRTRSYDDFGWLVTRVDPEQSLYRVVARDARGNPVREANGLGVIHRTFDAAGRPLNSQWSLESTSYDWGGTPAKWYEVFAYDSLWGFDFGRSNGRLVWSIRANHPVTNQGSVDFGWFGVTSYYHYTGLGGRLGFRQQSDLLMPEPALIGPQSSDSLSAEKKSALRESFQAFFRNQGRAAKSKADLIRGVASEEAARAMVAGNPYFPEGVARWSYAWDSAGRLSSVTYPRRDEGYPTTATYGYDSGFLTSVNATFRDPFSWGPVGSVAATLDYDASGRVRSTLVSTSAQSGAAFQVVADRDSAGLARLGSWQFFRRDGNQLTEHELREYSYDPSGNISAISVPEPTLTYRYDARGRLISDWILGRLVNPETREYDGFGNLVRVVGASDIPLTTSWSSNRLSSTLALYDGAGRMTEDKYSSIGRDYYPDGALTAEYSHLPGSNATLYPGGISVWLADGKAENALAFWGDSVSCEAEQFRSLVRDENAQILTEYNGETESACVCSTPCVWRDRFYRDVVRLGPWATASYTRGTGIRLEARDHLGTPRFVTNATGSILSTVILDSFGQSVSGSPATREAFTGHERNHISGDGNQLPLSDYMHARTYVPMLGRFTRPDPIDSFALEEPQTLNRYTYAKNNPLVFVDPDGRAPAAAGAGVVRSVARVATKAAVGAAIGAGVRVFINAAIRTTNPDFDLMTGVKGSAVTGAITGGVNATSTLGKFAANTTAVAAGALKNGVDAGHNGQQLWTDFKVGVATGLLSGALDSAASAGLETEFSSLSSEAFRNIEFLTSVITSTAVSSTQEALTDYGHAFLEALRAILPQQPPTQTQDPQADDRSRSRGD